MDRKKILIVDDEPVMMEQLQEMLRREGYEVKAAENGEEALGICSGAESVVITDMKMPVMDGMELLRNIRKVFPGMPVIMVTAHATVKSAVEAMKEGATDYITKPYDAEEIFIKIKKIMDHQRIVEENLKLKGQIGKQFDIGKIVGKSKRIKEIIDLIRQVAPTPASVLIQGPSGSGKEMIARGIHYLSERRNESFVVVNCAAIPETLLEAELFGYKKGSFTDAKADKKGCFEEADKGTIFLDEIADMSVALQAKMLRVLQEKEFTKIGETKSKKVDVRIVAATNKRLKEEIASGRFREDLYFRINVINIDVPGLMERKEDIPILVEHFIRKYNFEIGKKILDISEAAMDLLKWHSWPGNIRELENTIEKGVILTRGDTIKKEVIEQGLEPLGFETGENAGGGLCYREEVRMFERALIERALEESRRRISDAAVRLGISRHSLRYQMMKLEMKVDDMRD